jgi:hypothetical protein
MFIDQASRRGPRKSKPIPADPPNDANGDRQETRTPKQGEAALASPSRALLPEPKLGIPPRPAAYFVSLVSASIRAFAFQTEG